MKNSTFKKLETDSTFTLDDKKYIVESRVGSNLIYSEYDNRLKQTGISEGDFNILSNEGRIKIINF